MNQLFARFALKVCKSKANLYNHKRDVHEEIENLSCNLCGDLQKNYSYLSRHKRRFCKFKPLKIEANTKCKTDVVRDEGPHQANFAEKDDISGDEIEIVTDDSNLQTMDQSKSEEETKSGVPKLEKTFLNTTKSETDEFLDDDQTNEYLLRENEEQHDDWEYCDLETKNSEFLMKLENMVHMENYCGKTIKTIEDVKSSKTIKLKESKINKDDASIKRLKQEIIDDVTSLKSKVLSLKRLLAFE